MSRNLSAAIFDLDRTLISGSSSTVFMRHLTEAGVADVGKNPLIEPLVELAQFTLKAVYDIAGESRLLMQPAKLAVRAAVGWNIGDVDAACAKAAKEIVEMFYSEICTALENNDQVKISGFGNFELRDKSSRPGRNPKTGEEIPISARRVVTFKPGQKLKARVENYAGTK